MSQIADKIFMLMNEFQTALYIALVTVCVLGIGLAMMMGGQARDGVKRNWMWYLLGALLVGGAITLGADYGAKLMF